MDNLAEVASHLSSATNFCFNPGKITVFPVCTKSITKLFSFILHSFIYLDSKVFGAETDFLWSILTLQFYHDDNGC